MVLAITATLDLLTYWMLNVSSAFMLSAANNVLFFVLDLRMPVLHFLHNAVPALFLLVRLALSPDRRPLLPRLLYAIVRAPLRSLLWRPVMAQLVVSALATRVHAHNRAGALYLCRIFDFIGTLLIIRFASIFLHNSNVAVGGKDDYHRRRGRAICTLLCPLAFSASLSWLEFGNIEWDPWALCLAPLLALAQAVHILLLKQAQLAFFAALGMPNAGNGGGCCECEHGGTDAAGAHRRHPQRCAMPDETFEWFALCYLVAVGTLLAPTALHSYAHSVVPYDASWESIDYLLMSMSVVFMSGYKYSELWLISRLEGQWFLQNMAHATIFAAIGKALFVVSALRYWLRADEMDAMKPTLGAGGGARAKEKCGAKSSLAG